MAFCIEKTHPSSFFSQSEASASLGRVDDVIRMECDQSATRASPSPIIHQSATSDVIGVKGQVDDEGMGLRRCGRGGGGQGQGEGQGARGWRARGGVGPQMGTAEGNAARAAGSGGMRGRRRRRARGPAGARGDGARAAVGARRWEPQRGTRRGRRAAAACAGVGGGGRGGRRACPGMARALARAVGEEKLRFGSVSSNPGRGGKIFFCFWFWRRDNFFSGRGE